MRTHIKVVGIVNLLFSALGLLAAASVLLGGVLHSVFSGSFVGAIVGSTVSVIMAILVGGFSLFGLVAGFGLLNHQQWARFVIIVVSGFRLFRFPFGTVFGAYSLWVLLNDETREIFNSHVG